MHLVGLCIALAAGTFLQGCNNEDLVEAHEQCMDIQQTARKVVSEFNASVVDLANTTKVNTTYIEQQFDAALNTSVISNMLSEIPDPMEFGLGGRISDETPIGSCDLGYTLGATLDECTGLSSIAATMGLTQVRENAQGDVIVTVPMVISSSAISCSGHACARGELCGANVIKVAAKATPTFTIPDTDVTVVLKQEIKDGEECYNMEGVEISGVELNWVDMAVNFNGAELKKLPLPEDALTKVWKNLELSQVKDILNEKLRELLEKQMSTINTCF